MKIIPRSDSSSAADVAADLRALADLVENDGDGYVAAVLWQLINAATTWPAHAASRDTEYQRVEIMAEAIRRFKKVATQPIRKEYNDSGAGYFDAVVPMRGITIALTDLREEVCERVVTGVETVIDTVPDPEYIANAPTVDVTREVETFEWKCGPVLAAAHP